VLKQPVVRLRPEENRHGPRLTASS
jgi:hypothetical protein